MLSWQSSRFRATFRIISITIIEIIFIVFSLPLPISELNHRSFYEAPTPLKADSLQPRTIAVQEKLNPVFCLEATNCLVPPLLTDELGDRPARQAVERIKDYLYTAKKQIEELIKFHSDIFLPFNEIPSFIEHLIGENKTFVLTMLDGDSVKNRNKRFGKKIVDVMILEMIRAFIKTAESLGKDPDKIDMKVFRRGGDEFGFLINSEELGEFDVKAIHELMRIRLPSMIESKYGVFTIDLTTPGSLKQLNSLLIELKSRSIVQEFETLGEKLVVLYNKEKIEEVKSLKEEVKAKGFKETEEVGYEFALTGSMGALYVNQGILSALHDDNLTPDFNVLIAGANYALSKAKEESKKPEKYERKKGNRIYLLSVSEPLNTKEWFHGTGDDGTCVFKKPEIKEEIKVSFSDSKIPKEEQDPLVSSVFNYNQLRELMKEDPRGRVISVGVLWKDQPELWEKQRSSQEDEAVNKFIEAVKNAEKEGKIYKGLSYLEGFYTFGMMNDALPARMSDADWAIKFLGYFMNERAKNKFGKDFNVAVARAPPEQGADRFLIWLRPDENIGEVEEEYFRSLLKEFLQSVSADISDNTYFDVSLQAAVVPISGVAGDPLVAEAVIIGNAFRELDLLSGLYVYSDRLQLEKRVTDRFKDAIVSPDDNKNIIVTDRGHQIVIRDNSAYQQRAITKTVELKARYALEELRNNLPGIKEDYHKTLRRLYANVAGMDIKLHKQELEHLIPDEMSIDEAAEKIIGQIKKNRNFRLAQSDITNRAAIVLPEFEKLREEIRSAEKPRQGGKTIVISLNDFTFTSADSVYRMFDINEALRTAAEAGNELVIALFSEKTDEIDEKSIRDFLISLGVPIELISKIVIGNDVKELIREKGNNCSVLFSNIEDVNGLKEKLGVSNYGILKTDVQDPQELPSLLRGIAYLMALNGTLKVESREAFISSLIGSVIDERIPNYTTTLETAKTIREKL